MEKNESSKLNSKSPVSVSGSVLGVASIGEGDARASTPVSGPDPGCWRFRSRVNTAKASSSGGSVGSLPALTSVTNSGTSHPRSADAGKVLETAAVVTIILACNIDFHDGERIGDTVTMRAPNGHLVIEDVVIGY